MDEMELLASEASTLCKDAIVYAEHASQAESVGDAKTALKRAIHVCEEIRDRLEEALDFAEAELHQVSIEDALIHVDDAIDEGMLALQDGDVSGYIRGMRYEISESLAHIDSLIPAEA